MNQDWRLQGQKQYLDKATLHRKKYVRFSETWDHDHCEFCGAKFAPPDELPDALHEGYATADNYRWVCRSCFDDFRDQFQWQVTDQAEHDQHGQV